MTGDQLITISTKARAFKPGDVLYRVGGDVTIATNEYTASGGLNGSAWMTFTNGQRESFPAEMTLYRVVPA